MMLSAQLISPEMKKDLQLTQAKFIQTNREATHEIQSLAEGLKAKAAVQYGAADQYVADGLMMAGYTEDYKSYYGQRSFLFVPYSTTGTEWFNLWGETTWSVNGKQTATNTDTYVAPYGINGAYYLPQTADHVAKAQTAAGKDTTINVRGYFYGEKNGYENAAVFVAPSVEVDEETGNVSCWPMTLCGMLCSPLYEGSEGKDCWWVGAGNRGQYSYGTNLNVGTAEEPVMADKMGIYMANEGIMQINQVIVPIVSNAKDKNGVIPAGAELKLTLYPVDEEGVVDFTAPMAEATATQEDFNAPFETQGCLNFHFYKTNILGVKSVYSPVIYGDFFAEFTNYNESGCDFGILCDYYNENTYTTYFHIGEELTTLWSDGGSNLAVSWDAYWPTLVVESTETLIFPTEGGYGYYASEKEEDPTTEYSWILLSSNLLADELLDEETGKLIYFVDSEEESSIQLAGFDDSIYEEENILGCIFGADANDEYDIEGEIIFAFDDEDLPLFTTVPFIQAGKLGPRPEGVEKVTVNVTVARKEIANGHVVIKKGDKTFSIMGQEIK